MSIGDVRAIQVWVTTMIGTELDREQGEDDPEALTVIVWLDGVWVYEDADTAFIAFRRLTEKRHYPNILQHLPPELWAKLLPRVLRFSTVIEDQPLSIKWAEGLGDQ